MIQTAWLDVRVFPWKPRPRMMNPNRLRDEVGKEGPFDLLNIDDVAGGLVVGLAVLIGVYVLAPLIVLLMAVALFSVELPLAIGLALVMLIVRFTGIIPWTVVVHYQVNGWEESERHRSIFRAVGRIREINHDRRVRVRWSWA